MAAWGALITKPLRAFYTCPMLGLTAGQAFGPYEIVGLIAKGGMGAVYRARTADGKEVALKTLAEQFWGDASMRARFEKEPQLSPLHPGVVRILDAGVVNGTPYFAMDLVEGKGLDAVLQQHGPFTAHDFYPILNDVAAALDGAHHAGVVHRDIKPSNVMLRSQDNRAMLTDFGIAKRVGVEATATSSTQAGAIVGTVRYMSPEQALGKPVTNRSDVYSLGALAYEMLSGKAPFEAPDAFALMRMHIQDTPVNLSAVAPAVPEAITNVVNTALAKDPARRFASAGEFARAFFNALTGKPAESAATLVMGAPLMPGSQLVMPAPSARKPGGLSPAIVIGAVLLILGATALATVMLVGGRLPGSTPVGTTLPVRSTVNNASVTPFATVEGMPKLVSPAAGTVFDAFPRTTHFDWRDVPNATNYVVEIDCLNCCEQGKWCSELAPPKSVKRTVTGSALTFEFFGAQPGRWRVWALFAGGREGPKSDWSTFSYTR